tara:strand:+ start:404845 stop:405879 length:1035 start_codon:yes stop_codon:yes gene_type:complete
MGWEPFFQQQLSAQEWEQTTPCRVTAVHRGQLILTSADREIILPLTGKILTDDNLLQSTVGDWLLLEKESEKFVRQLERKSLFKRKAAGTANRHQLVAANINTLFLVTSCNEDFNISRLERYLALAYDAKVEPVIILTKIDLAEDVNKFVDQVRALDDLLMVEPVNALEPKTLISLKAWCKAGQTIALMGSSGVGKSTIANGLGSVIQKTSKIRESDAKGKHTTTHRSLLPLKDGAILLDTPGMRELQITDCEVGVATVFADIETLSANCRFNNCRHDNEPGCAVRVAIDAGDLEPRRLASYGKLMAEQARNAATLAEKRQKDKELSKFYSRTIKQSHKLKGMT